MMKKLTTVLTAAAMTAAAVSAVPFTASAADTVYGTMQIPYADFFKAEFADAANADVEVDAVSSATANKWSGNAVGSVDADGNWQQGGLAAGTYCEANEAGGGTILGVVYPVAISADDQAFLTENYGFTPLETAPTAYKEVTVTDGVVSFGKLVDTDGAQNVGGNVTLQTQTNYGDYQITVENYPQDADTYAAIVKTSDGNYYAMRALENIWRRGEYAWSVGYVTQTHGNNIDNADYYGTNGATITEIDIITLDGYRVVDGLSLYLPVIFTNGVTVESGAAGTGSVTYDTSAFPADFQQSASVADGFSAANGTISYEGAQPGSYQLTVNDASGKYADVRGSFTLSTADIPVQYADGKLVPADGFTEADAANFLKNITSVKVGETAYRTGRRGTTVIDPTSGEVLFDAKSGDTAVFDGSGTYSLSVTATGYSTTYDFTIAPAEEPTEATEATTSTTATTATTKATTATTKTTTKATTKSGSTGAASPKTGDAAGLPLAGLAIAAGAAAVLSKKRK